MSNSDWFFYDWHMENDPARFAVDMSLVDRAPAASRPALVHMRCEMQNEGELGARAKRHIARIEKKCIDLPKSVYAGYVEDAYRRVMFFYVDDPQRFDAFDEIAAKEKYLYCAPGCAMDEEWSTYLTLLYPDAARLYTETNAKNIAKYKQNGDSITAARRVTFHMFFPLEPLVLQFAAEARLSGFAIGDSEFNPDIEEPYGVKLHRICPLTKPELDGCTSSLIYIAERYMGRLLYWESPVIPKNSPLR